MVPWENGEFENLFRLKYKACAKISREIMQEKLKYAFFSVRILTAIVEKS
jgi:hypothetical protein